MFPANKQFTSPVRDVKKAFPTAHDLTETASFKCWGRSPERPPEDPALKESTAERTSLELICRGGTSVSGKGLRSFGRGGCFSRNFKSVTLSKGAIVSELLTNRTAHFTSPSSSFLETMNGSFESLVLLDFRFMGESDGVTRYNRSFEERKAEQCLLITRAIEAFLSRRLF